MIPHFISRIRAIEQERAAFFDVGKHIDFLYEAEFCGRQGNLPW